MNTKILKKKIIFKGYITLKTGLHIGGTNAALNIGGPDKFVVRNPLNNIPYIPGSSLKGKMRSLIELKHGESINGKPSNNTSTKSGALFGVSGDSDNSRPSRLIVRDSPLVTEKDTDADLEEYGLSKKNIPDFRKTDLPYTETKTEVSIDRVTAKANPRTFERVPAGAIFKLNMVLNVFEDEDETSLKQTLKEAISLLEDDYLGGHGSRGYGHVLITLVKEDGDSKIYK